MSAPSFNLLVPGYRSLDSAARDAVLLAVGGLLHREVAIDELLERLVDDLCARMDADRGTIYLLDRGKGELFSKAAHLPEIDEIRLELGQGVAGHVAATGEVVNVPSASAEDRFYGGVDEQTGYRTESMLAVPMRDRGGAVLGVVQLLNKRGGAFTPADARELVRLAGQVAAAIEATTLYQELSRPPESQLDPLPIAGRFNRIVGESEALRKAGRLTAKAAASEATVLVRGPSGTGKELFARAIHVNSRRSEGPFVKVDCAALPESLIDNELFGHERGAFTGADRRAPGKVDAARGGTLFLDEIGELPLGVQGKLLRLLQDRDFLRVGGTEPVETDARVVTATNRDLEAMVKEGRFRSDLYYRVKVVQIVLPSLWERGKSDIARLARHFSAASAKRHGRPLPSISGAAMERLCAYRWPGNVRELENCIESAVVIMDGREIGPDDLPLPDRAPSSAPARSDDLTLATAEQRHLLAVLARAGNNRTVAARLLGIGRNTLARKLKQYGVD